MKKIKFKYKDKIYKSAWSLMQQLIEDELVTFTINYGRDEYIAEFYLLQEDYEMVVMIIILRTKKNLS